MKIKLTAKSIEITDVDACYEERMLQVINYLTRVDGYTIETLPNGCRITASTQHNLYQVLLHLANTNITLI